MNISGNTILITGGTSGIGLKMIRQLIAAGNKVLICGRRMRWLQEIKNEYPQVEIRECDAAVAADREALIINVSSGLAFAPLAFMPVYCATKAAMHSLSLSLRHQLKNTPVKVFEVIPPSVDIELNHHNREDKILSHGGMPVAEFVTDALKGIENDEFEIAVGQAVGLRVKREKLFAMMNR